MERGHAREERHGGLGTLKSLQLRTQWISVGSGLLQFNGSLNIYDFYPGLYLATHWHLSTPHWLCLPSSGLLEVTVGASSPPNPQVHPVGAEAVAEAITPGICFALKAMPRVCPICESFSWCPLPPSLAFVITGSLSNCHILGSPGSMNYKEIQILTHLPVGNLFYKIGMRIAILPGDIRFL